MAEHDHHSREVGSESDILEETIDKTGHLVDRKSQMLFIGPGRVGPTLEAEFGIGEWLNELTGKFSNLSREAGKENSHRQWDRRERAKDGGEERAAGERSTPQMD